MPNVLFYVKAGASGNSPLQETLTLEDGPDASNRYWHSLAWSPSLNLFATVSQNTSQPMIMTSPDGETWTGRTDPNSPHGASGYYHVAWSSDLGMFAAVGAGVIATSTDGTTWTSRTCPVTAAGASVEVYHGLTWSTEEGIWVASRTSNGNASTHYRYMTSTDGISWTGNSSPATYSWTDVAWSSSLGLFCSVASSTSGFVHTSPDGLTWTTRSTGLSQGWSAVAWSESLGLFVVVSAAGNAITSPDGINWTERTMPGSGNVYASVVWAAELGQFWAVARLASLTGNTGLSLVKSTDGINWSAGPDTTGKDFDWREIEYSPELNKLCVSAWDNDQFMLVA